MWKCERSKIIQIIPDEKVVPIEQLVPRKKREFDASEFEVFTVFDL